MSMRVMRSIAATSVLALAVTGLAAASATAATAAPTGGEQQYVVVFAEGTSSAEVFRQKSTISEIARRDAAASSPDASPVST